MSVWGGGNRESKLICKTHSTWCRRPSGENCREEGGDGEASNHGISGPQAHKLLQSSSANHSDATSCVIRPCRQLLLVLLMFLVNLVLLRGLEQRPVGRAALSLPCRLSSSATLALLYFWVGLLFQTARVDKPDQNCMSSIAYTCSSQQKRL
jgi:hypothetical protein